MPPPRENPRWRPGRSAEEPSSPAPGSPLPGLRLVLGPVQPRSLTGLGKLLFPTFPRSGFQICVVPVKMSLRRSPAMCS